MSRKDKSSGNFKENMKERAYEARTVRKITLIVLGVITIIMMILGFTGYQYVKSALKPVDPDSEEEIAIDIPMGSSTSDIAKILEEKDIIKDSLIFRFYIKFKNESNLQAGEYTFSPSMEINNIIASLKQGKVIKDSIYTVTVQEGLTVDEIADIYAEQLPIEKEAFMDKVNDIDYIEKLIEEYPLLLSDDILDDKIRTPLEGYLFAATYKFYEEEPHIEDIVEKMLEKSQNVIDPYIEDMEERQLTVHEAMTISSLVEMEAATKDQREQIAGLFYNRMNEDMKLQTDPTVLYAMGEHKDKVVHKDLEVDSPYNTYQVDGLPVGPIANFAENSLQATIFPEESDYIYFLHDDEGGIHYSETYEEHQKKKEEYIDE